MLPSLPNPIADQLSQQRCNAAGVVIGGPQHALGMFGNLACKPPMAARDYCSPNSFQYQFVPFLHVSAPSLRGPTCN